MVDTHPATCSRRSSPPCRADGAKVTRRSPSRWTPRPKPAPRPCRWPSTCASSRPFATRTPTRPCCSCSPTTCATRSCTRSCARRAARTAATRRPAPARAPSTSARIATPTSCGRTTVYDRAASGCRVRRSRRGPQGGDPRRVRRRRPARVARHQGPARGDQPAHRLHAARSGSGSSSGCSRSPRTTCERVAARYLAAGSGVQATVAGAGAHRGGAQGAAATCSTVVAPV